MLTVYCSCIKAGTGFVLSSTKTSINMESLGTTLFHQRKAAP